MNNKRAVSSKIVKGCWKYQIVVKVAKTEEEKQVGEICIFQIQGGCSVPNTVFFRRPWSFNRLVCLLV